jgi:hypothetical protein
MSDTNIRIADLPIKRKTKRLLTEPGQVNARGDALDSLQTVGEIRSEAQVLRIAGFGRRALADLKGALERLGIVLPVSER